MLTQLDRGRSWGARFGALVGLAGIVLAAGAEGACSSSSAKASGSDDGGGGATTSPSTPDCKATVSQGAMTGTKSGTTCEYRGIPYAQPPVGALRWMPPEPAGPFAKPLQATAYGASCPQTKSLLSAGLTATSEDCLFVNVFTPQNAPAGPLPVMVFIYGGAFTSGSSSLYDGAPLSEKGPVVVVTLNYRLGALGFLALPELDAQRNGKPSGSDGIRDQQLALQWVHDNISVFNGDPSNVTVFGESAGSLSTCVHLVSPGSQGLAKRYIMESVACVGNGEPIYSQQQAYTVGESFASSLCGGDAGATGDGEDLLACLRGQSADSILMWSPAPGSLPASPTSELLGTLLGPPFTPTVEGTGGVLPDTPANLIAQGQFNTSAEIMAGTNLNEFGLFTFLETLTPSAAPQLEISTAAQLDQGLTTAFGASAAAVEQQYQPITDANASQTLINIVTDYAFRCPTRQLAQMLQAKGVSSYYLYSYEVGKAWHSLELKPLFDVTALSALDSTPISAGFTQTMLGYWTQFGITGNPGSAGDGGAPNWPTNAVAGSDQYMQLVDPTPDVMTHLAQANCEFWANLGPVTGGSAPEAGAGTPPADGGAD